MIKVEIKNDKRVVTTTDGSFVIKEGNVGWLISIANYPVIMPRGKEGVQMSGTSGIVWFSTCGKDAPSEQVISYVALVAEKALFIIQSHEDKDTKLPEHLTGMVIMEVGNVVRPKQ